MSKKHLTEGKIRTADALYMRVFGDYRVALVRAVWCEFYDADKQRWSKARLLLMTGTDLPAEEKWRAATYRIYRSRAAQRLLVFF